MAVTALNSMPHSKKRTVSTDRRTDSIYHCSFQHCLYAPGSERYFTSKRLLEQHIQKVHAEKKYPCSKCDKKFGTKWLRKNHELSCGRKWVCSCGAQYSLRETLLTHVRRFNHSVPEDIWITPRRLLKHLEKTRNPPIVVIQPIIQQPVALIVPQLALGQDQKLVLPKQLIFRNNNGIIVSPLTTPIQTLPAAPTLIPARAVYSEASVRGRPSKERKQKSHSKTVAETQTSEEFAVLNKSQQKLESRGSQCTTQLKKRVVNESAHTHTQTTMESVVGRMKKKTIASRSRRKSVAIVTDPCELLQPTSSLWPNIGEFFLPSHDDPERENKSSGTQTNPSPIFDTVKETCDSQTITDELLLPKWWEDWNPAAIENDQIFMGSSTVFSNAESHMNDSVLPIESGSSMERSAESHRKNSMMNIETVAADSTEDASNSDPKLEDFDDLDSVFQSIIEDSHCFETITQVPPSSDSHTQTNLLNVISPLSNMETQTNEDFHLSNMEFFDIETQTPWEDACDFGAQLSIESQTDFSTFGIFNSGRNEISSMGRHIETQTSDVFKTPELTNSEAQTLINSYLFK